MIRILPLANPNTTGSSHYRVWEPLRWIGEDRNFFVRYERAGMNITQRDLQFNDIVFFERAANPEALQAIQMAKMYGRKIWLDYDDLLWEVPTANISLNWFHDRKPTIMQCIEQADLITCTTEFLKEALGRPEITVVAPNAVPPPTHILPKHPKAPVKVAWRGSQTHAADFRGYEDKVIEMDDDPNLELHFIGYLPPFLGEERARKFVDEIRWHPWRDNLLHYFELLAQLQPDFMLVTLDDSDFNKSKSNIAWLEGTSMAGASLVSNQVGEFGTVPGLHIDSFNHKSAMQKEKLVKQSLKLIAEKFNIFEVTERRKAALMDVMSNKAIRA